MRSKTRVLIADDQKLFAENLQSVLGFRSKDFEVVAIAANGRQAVESVRALKPELVLMDVRMPVLDGVQATRLIHQEFPEIPILVLTSFDDDEYIVEAMQHGAMGYILKDTPFNELLAALHAVREGTASFSPSIVSKLVHRGPAPEAGSPPPWLGDLSRREKQILLLLAAGRDNQQIAHELFISEQTVKNYVYGIYTKLDEHNRIKVMRIVQEFRSFLEPDF
jgi:DNA-binding NarL/FixJ family response regulator